MKIYPVVNLGQFEGLPLNGDTLSRLCDAVLSWHGAPNTNEGARTMRDSVADIKSILGPMGLTDRRAAEAQIRQACPRNPTPILDQIPFAVPPTAEQTTTAYTPFSTRETPPPSPPEAYKPVESVDRFIRQDEEPAESLGPEGLTYPPPPGNPIPPPMIPTGPSGPSGPVKCWYTPGQGYSWGPPPSGAQPTDIQKQSDCENLVRTQGEIRGFAVQQPQVPAQTQVTDQSTGMTATQATGGMKPPAGPTEPAPVATGGPEACGPGQFVDPVTRRCRGSVSGGYGNVAFGGGGGMAIPAGGASGMSLMGRRFPVVNIRRG